MNATLVATFAGLATAFFWGSSDYLSARSTRKLSPFQISLAGEVVFVYVAFVLFLSFGLHVNSAAQVVRIACYSVFLNIAYLTFLQALSKGAVGIVVPLGNIYPFFTVILTLAFRQAHFNAAEVTAMLVIVFGAVLLAYEKNHSKLPLRQLHHKTMLALAAAIIWGVGFFILNPIVDVLSWQTIAIVSETVSIPVVLLCFGIMHRRDFRLAAKAAFRTPIAYTTAVAGQAGMLTFYFGSTKAGSVVIPAVLSACGPLIASLWGRMFDRERIGWLKRAGAVVVVAGIIILNLN